MQGGVAGGVATEAGCCRVSHAGSASRGGTGRRVPTGSAGSGHRVCYRRYREVGSVRASRRSGRSGAAADRGKPAGEKSGGLLCCVRENGREEEEAALLLACVRLLKEAIPADSADQIGPIGAGIRAQQASAEAWAWEQAAWSEEIRRAFWPSRDKRSDDSKGSSSSVQSEKNEAIEIGLNLVAPDCYLYSFPSPKISQAYPAKENDQETTVGENLGHQNDKREAEESPANISKSSTLKIGEEEAELDMLLASFKETSLSGSIQGDLLDNKPASGTPFDESLPFDWKSAAQNPSYVIRKQPADAELDMLLDSSKETSLSGAIHGGLLDHTSNSRAPNSDFLYPMHQQSSDRIQFSSKNVVTASIDDSIDDLLAETSSILQKQKHTRALAAAPQLGSMPSTANLSHPHSGSSSIDDLPGGRKSLLTQNGVASSMGYSSNPGSEGVQMDDFDSWMDSF